MSIEIRTQNCTLEPIIPDHAEKLFGLLQAPELYTFIPQNPPTDILALENKYKRWSTGQSDNGDEIWLNFAIFHLGLQQYIGTLQSTIIKAEKKSYIAYEIFPAFWQQGFAKEACSTLIDYIEKQYAPASILAHVDTRNEASIGLLQSLGFKLQETIYHADEFKGSVSDEYVYSYY